MIYLKLFWMFLKIGAFSFGGGYAMLPLIRAEVVSNGFMTEEALVNFIAISESTPGPFAVNISTYIGITTGGIPGAIAATLGVILPSFVIILIVAKFFDKFKSSKIVYGCMSGLKPAVIGLIAAAIIQLGISVFLPSDIVEFSVFSPDFLISVLIFICMLLAALKKFHPIVIIFASAVIGIASRLIFA